MIDRTMPQSLADQIRGFVYQHYVVGARSQGRTEVEVRPAMFITTCIWLAGCLLSALPWVRSSRGIMGSSYLIEEVRFRAPMCSSASALIRGRRGRALG
jgi:hypothetical protein